MAHNMEDEMKRLMTIAAVMMMADAFAFAADQMWTGRISDASCGAKHGMAKMTDRECTAMCAKGGGKYVVVVGEKVFKIANQDHKDLAKFAGEPVMLMGEMKGDTITVSKIETPAKK